MKKFHISIAVKNLKKSIIEYSKKLDCNPEIIIEEKYALWCTECVNFSISQKSENYGIMRHVGFENPNAMEFNISQDCNGIT